MCFIGESLGANVVHWSHLGVKKSLSVFAVYGKNANFGHWRPLNDFLCKKSLHIFAVFFGVFGPQNMHLFFNLRSGETHK